MKVLIADDDRTTRRMLRAALSKWGHEVCEAATGDEAWAHLTGPEASPLAIVDWMMPGLSGPELCHRLKSRRQEPMPYLILLTSRTELQDVVSALDAGADDFIAKPYNIEEMRARLSAGCRVVTLQQQLLALNEQLEQRVQDRTHRIQDLLQQKQELIVQLGHDLRTPLTPLVGLLPILASGEQNQDRRESLELCVGQVQQLRRLAERILDLGQLDAPNTRVAFRPVGLRDLAEDSLEPFFEAREDSERLTIQIAPELMVQGDPRWLQRVFENLVDNAVQYSPPETPIVVSAELHENEVRVSVTDRGCGLLPRQLERVFEPFFTGDAARHDRRANGLGLTFCRRIVEHHGGRIWAESEGAGRGTSFRFTLPLADPHPGRPPTTTKSEFP